MELTFEQIKDSPLNILRRLGYSFLRRDGQTGQMSFIRRVGGGDYPRFHIYVQQEPNGRIILTLHLDQKKASYQGSAAHSGEYEEEGWIAREAEELKREFAKYK